MKRGTYRTVISPTLAALIFAAAGIATPSQALADRAPAPRDGARGEPARHHEGGDAGGRDSGGGVGRGDSGGGVGRGDSGGGIGSGDSGGGGGSGGGSGGGGGGAHGTPAPLAGVGLLALAALGYGSRRLRRQPQK